MASSVFSEEWFMKRLGQRIIKRHSAKSSSFTVGQVSSGDWSASSAEEEKPGSTLPSPLSSSGTSTAAESTRSAAESDNNTASLTTESRLESSQKTRHVSSPEEESKCLSIAPETGPQEATPQQQRGSSCTPELVACGTSLSTTNSRLSLKHIGARCTSLTSECSSPSAPFEFRHSDSDVDSPVSTPRSKSQLSAGSFLASHLKDADGLLHRQFHRSAMTERPSPKPRGAGGQQRSSPKDASGGLSLRRQLARSSSLHVDGPCMNSTSASSPDNCATMTLVPKCANFNDVTQLCQERDSAGDFLEGLLIIPLLGGAEQEPPEVLYALYFKSKGDAPSLPGDECTRVLFPRNLQDASKGPDLRLSSRATINRHGDCGGRFDTPRFLLGGEGTSEFYDGDD